jgi:hypothetical protein
VQHNPWELTMAHRHGKRGKGPFSSLDFTRRDLLKAGLVLGASTLIPRPARAAVTKQKGLFTNVETENPELDADVIVTAVMLGYSFKRIHEEKDCRFDVEIRDPELKKDWTEKEIKDEVGDVQVLGKCVDKLNEIILPFKGRKVEVGVSPLYEIDKTGKHDARRRITGGSGDLPSTDKRRYNPDPPTGLSAQLYTLGLTGIGYQGRGAYTGFVAGRTSGQSALMSTIRHNIPTGGHYGRRWHPRDGQVIGAAVGDGPTQRTWGMIVNNKTQQPWDAHGPRAIPTNKSDAFFTHDDYTKSIMGYGMHFVDPTTVPGTDIVGYTHGMIQAIYDVEFHKKATPNENPGTAYEIAVGNFTFKLSSCFPCSVFMEATGHPASSTHLGKGESWSPLYQKPTTAGHDPWDPNNLSGTQPKSWAETNKKYFKYLWEVLQQGNTMMLGAVAQKKVKDSHKPSVTALNDYLHSLTADTWANHLACGNLFLDALTVHKGEAQRIVDTLVDPPHWTTY